MSSATCPHGLSPDTCQICRVLEPTAVPAGRAGGRAAKGSGAGLGGNLAVLAVVAVVGFVALGWVAAAFFAVLRILELLAIAAIAGWLGWKLGVRQGRRRPESSQRRLVAAPRPGGGVRCRSRLWNPQATRPLAWVVAPPAAHGTTWSISQPSAGSSQSSSSRASSAQLPSKVLEQCSCLAANRASAERWLPSGSARWAQ